MVIGVNIPFRSHRDKAVLCGVVEETFDRRQDVLKRTLASSEP